MKVNEIRSAFLDFFKEKEHYLQESFPLVPINDKSLLLINAGMAPMKNYFIGTETPPSKRIVSCQKCIRTGDIENVGITARHATFFEMLGNFSFGDYFKDEATKWAWEFVTEHLKLNPELLWVTVYEEDDEALEIWAQKIGVSRDRIVKLGKEDNFWEIGTGTGPCGPCSEIYIDRGEKYGCGSDSCKPGCECDRFLEFWNLVFTQFDKDEQGNYNRLENPNIDTGMGLERIACIMQGVDSIFDIDTMKSIRDQVCLISGKEYNKNPQNDISIRIVTDHVRAVTFMLCDGILPSNEGRGYILRRLLRRAARHGKLLGINQEFLCDLCDVVIAEFEEAYPELAEKKEYIKKIILIEEQKFIETIDQGLTILEDLMKNLDNNKFEVLSGEDAFKLYDTFGFPIEMTEEILQENSKRVDREEFERLMDGQREKARTARLNQENEGWKKDNLDIPSDITTEFVGYESTQADVKVLYINNASDGSDVVKAGEKGIVIFDKTPFYAEGGGQVGDKGKLSSSEVDACIVDTQKSTGTVVIHKVEVNRGQLKVGDSLKAQIEEVKRKSIQANHSATHLLHRALKMVLGEHVAQAGSYVNDNRLRFDFTHFEALTEQELDSISEIVNNAILKSYKVKQEHMSIKDAKKAGATAQFDEKYGNEVRVVSMGDFSMELCGGTHVDNTSEIMGFKILSENGVAAGTRRIEAVTGKGVMDYLKEKELKLNAITDILKCKEITVISRLEQIVEENRNYKKEIEKLKKDIAISQMADLINTAEKFKGIKLVRKSFKDMSAEDLRNTAELLIDRDDNMVVLLASESEGKINFVCAAGKMAQSRGAHAGKIVKEVAAIAGGGGGGKPNFAQAGGKNSEKLEDSMNSVLDIASALIAD
ncbi:alanine--tRNA ligase [Proteocatella sphenisci]|uniref:alanine--tRNA ligase n=1 Tax=Proteocatella sphenisci TaxID=181070 RepID=UPI000490EAC3|nr:alanine--tRNA ligase [Proteocatella sphenisci]